MKIDSLPSVAQGIDPDRAGGATPAAFQQVLERAYNNALASEGGAAPKPAKTESKSLSQAQSAHEAVLAEFRECIRKSPMERMREQIMKEMGISEEDLKSMTPEQQNAIEAAIAEQIKLRLQAQNGIPHDGQQQSKQGAAGTPSLLSMT